MTALLILSLFAFPAFAQEAAYERTITLPAIPQETSVWVPLDLHALQPDTKGYVIEQDGTPIPWKQIDRQQNLLQLAIIDSASTPAETVPLTTIDALTDGNALTSFQPATATTHRFRFHFVESVAPSYLRFQLESGGIYNINVRAGSSFDTLQPLFTGTHVIGNAVPLSGERATHYEITFSAVGVLRIAEADLVSNERLLLFRAQPNSAYVLRYGPNSIGAPVDSADVFDDASAVTASLGPVRFLGEGPDTDGDGSPDSVDNCVNTANMDQRDRDGDGIGDTCDNAPALPNSAQKDTDGDGIGDSEDNCPFLRNPDQKDVDLDGIGWVCDDADGDGIINSMDNCVGLKNPDQRDLDNSGLGDACEDDIDKDGIPREPDNCSTTANPDQSDQDEDGIGDTCDVYPSHYDPRQIDRDENGIGDVCQNKLEATIVDTDEDGIPDNKDVCPRVPNSDQLDTDDDGIGDMCDNCPILKNPDQRDRDQNGEGDTCTDTDGDTVLDPFDNCPPFANTDQRDKDENGIGDPCDDDDRDGLQNAVDNCPYDSNHLQEDEDNDGIGNVCDTSDDRWSEERPWLLWFSMGTIVVVLTALGGMILYRSPRNEDDQSAS